MLFCETRHFPRSSWLPSQKKQRIQENSLALTEPPNEARHEVITNSHQQQKLNFNNHPVQTNPVDHQGTWTTLQEHLSQRMREFPANLTDSINVVPDETQPS